MRHSRHQRKGLPRSRAGLGSGALLRSLWRPRLQNWWIGTLFACGSLLFMLGGILSLAPEMAASWSLEAGAINRMFFAGSIPFTLAAYLQLHQAANARGPDTDAHPTEARVVVFGWQPGNSGWLSCALQFAGTLLFNVNTFDAMMPGLNWLQQDLEIWAPDIAGSILFLASGYLAFIEYGHGRWSWQPRTLSWWITSVNLLGCVCFMISALLAFVPPAGPAAEVVTLSILFTALGAAAFLIGSLLLLPEAAPE